MSPVKQPLDHLRSRKKPVAKRLPIPMDSELADAYNQAKIRLTMAQDAAKEDKNDRRLAQAASEASEELDRLKAELEPELAWFIARSIGPKRYDEVQSDNAPTEEQIKEAKKNGENPPNWNPETFPQALVAACVQYITLEADGETEVFTDLDRDFVDEMFDAESGQWNQGEVMGLFQTALEVNSMRRIVDMGNGSGRSRNSGKS
jgi:hypothetical protein